MFLNDVLRESSLPTYEVEFIFQELFNVPRHLLYQKRIDDDIYKAFLAIEEKRKQGIPLQYLLGVAYFYGLKLKVVPGVFIPRPETELLVEVALKYTSKGTNVLDIGTGSGNIALALSVNMTEDCIINAIDISSLSIMVARENKLDLEDKGLIKSKLTFWLGDVMQLFQNSAITIKYDLIVSNPPYLDFSDVDKLPREVRAEPPVALFASDSGLFFYKRIFELASKLLSDRGKIVVELPGIELKTNSIKAMATDLGYKVIDVLNDLNGRPRVLVVGL